MAFGRRRHLCICQMDCVYASKRKTIYNCTYERQYACIHMCIHRCAYVCECMIQSGQCRFPLPDCVCTLSDKQHVTLNSWHSLGWKAPICVFLKRKTKRPGSSSSGQNISPRVILIVILIFEPRFHFGGGSNAWKAKWGTFQVVFKTIYKYI